MPEERLQLDRLSSTDKVLCMPKPMEANSKIAPAANTSRWIITSLFFGTYLCPFILWIGSGLASGGTQNLSKINVILTFSAILIFPSGLFGFLIDSLNANWLAACGYIVYGLLFGMAFSLRRHWQTFLWWIVLVVLLVFNVIGCQAVWEHGARGVAPP